jgi:glycerol-3-phosphate O-acyltransferase
LQRAGSCQLTRARLEEVTYLLAQRLAMLAERNSAEFAEKVLFGNLIRSLIDRGLIEIDGNGMLCFDARITQAVEQTELLLAADVRHGIDLITRLAPAAGVAGPVDTRTPS